MIDLHIHTNCSDSPDSPAEVLRKAEKLKLDVISITDHDNCEAYGNLDTEIFSGRIITGIELQAYIEGISIELLGYGYDAVKMQELLKGLRTPFATVNIVKMKRLFEACIAGGMRFASNVVESYDKSAYYYATEHLHNEMRKIEGNRKFVPDEGSWERENIFYKRHTSNPNSPYYIDESDIIPAAGEIVDIIHKAGGKAFIPHIYQYAENSDLILNKLIDSCEIDGIECYYPTFTREQTEYLLDVCLNRDLLVSGGSDYHGGKRPIPMGVDIPVPEWTKRLHFMETKKMPRNC